MARCYILLKERKLAKNNSDAIIPNLLQTSKMLVKTTEKVFCNKAEAYRIRAIAFALAGKPAKALHFFNKSIDFAKWYGAKLELSKTYFELGKSLSSENIIEEQNNGKSAEQYFEESKLLFESCGMQSEIE